MNQRTIDDISDLLQGRDSEHREYPYPHPKYRPPVNAQLPYIPGTESTLTVDFESTVECKKFFDIFQGLGHEQRERTLAHLKEIGKITHGG